MSGSNFLDEGLTRLLTPKRIKVFTVILVIQIGIFWFAAVYPIPLSQSIQISQTYNQQTQGIYSLNPSALWVEIVTHNAWNAAVELVPFVGGGVMAVAAVLTGQILQAEAIAAGATYPTQNGLYLAITLFLFPHTIIEFSAYALAVTSSLFFFVALFRRKEPTKEIVRTFARGIAATYFLLAIAAAIEVTIINSVIVGGLLWFPVWAGIYWLWNWYKEHPQPLNNPVPSEPQVAIPA